MSLLANKSLGTWRRCLEGSKFTYLFMTNDEFYSQKKGKQGLGWGSPPQARILSKEHTTVKTIKANINHSDSHSSRTWRCWCCILRFYTFIEHFVLVRRLQLTNLSVVRRTTFFPTLHIHLLTTSNNNCPITTKTLLEISGLYNFFFLI